MENIASTFADVGLLGIVTTQGDDLVQVWSLSSFEVSCQLLTNYLNQVSSVSLIMTSLTALANEELFELTRRPLLTQAVLLSTVCAK